MLFTEPLFLFYFLPLALILHRLTTIGSVGQQYRNLSRACFFGLTLVFYGFKEPWWLFPFCVCIVFDFLWAYLLDKEKSERWRAFFLLGSVAQNLGLLLVFKYWDFVFGSIHETFPSLTFLPEISQDGRPLTLPPGISFYTFESLSFVIDVYQRRIKPPKNPFEFFGFIGMFPRFVAGPIVRYREMVDQFKKYAGMDVEKGLFIFSVGLFYKAALADSFAPMTLYAFGSGAQSTFAGAWIGVFAYTMQLYLDFAGYSIMAIGLGRAFGFQFPENFKTPYLSKSLQEFWTRWHMTLSQWVRDYIFTPLTLLGFRRSQAFVYPSLMITMVLFGAWHGASWTFVVMGAWFGLVLCIETAFPALSKMPTLLCRTRTLLVVMVGWVFMKSQSLAEAKAVLATMSNPTKGWERFHWEGVTTSPLLLVLCLFSVVFCFFIEPRWSLRELENAKPWVRSSVAVVLTLFSLMIAYSSEKIPFLYFQF